MDPRDTILANGPDRVAVALEVLSATADGAELLTIHYGADADLDEAERLAGPRGAGAAGRGGRGGPRRPAPSRVPGRRGIVAPAKDPASRPGRKPAGKAAKAEPPVIVTLDTPIGDSGLPGARTLHKVRDRLGVHTVRELLFHLPKDHRDLRALLSAAELRWVEDRKGRSARC
ncbi:MAG: hypothetical protein U0869_17775 [Chloroflexota bacterium]